jgi:hypothetical protein
MDFFGVQSVDTVGRCTTSYLLASAFVMPCFVMSPHLNAPKLSCPSLCLWYHWKALNKVLYMFGVSQFSDALRKSY